MVFVILCFSYAEVLISSFSKFYIEELQISKVVHSKELKTHKVPGCQFSKSAEWFCIS